MMVFTCGSSLRTHKKTVHVAQDERKKYPCPIKGCTHVALAKSSLKQHMVSSKHAKNAKRTFK